MPHPNRPSHLSNPTTKPFTPYLSAPQSTSEWSVDHLHKNTWEIFSFDRGRDRSERKFEGNFLFPVWIYFSMINYQLFQKLILIEIQEFGHLTIILTFSFTCETKVTKLYSNKWGLTCKIFKYFKWEVEWKWESNSKLPTLILW